MKRYLSAFCLKLKSVFKVCGIWREYEKKAGTTRSRLRESCKLKDKYSAIPACLARTESAILEGAGLLFLTYPEARSGR
jgi:hypothetical protein